MSKVTRRPPHSRELGFKNTRTPLGSSSSRSKRPWVPGAMDPCPQAAVTNYHRHTDGGSKPHKCVLFEFWEAESETAHWGGLSPGISQSLVFAPTLGFPRVALTSASIVPPLPPATP